MMRGKLSDAGRTGLKASAAIPNIRWTLIFGTYRLFFAFFEKPLTLAKLGRLDVRDFRAYLASRAAKHLEKSSIAREVSAVKKFFQMAGPQQYC